VPIVIWAGRMLAWKRLDLVLHAAKRLRDDGQSFIIKLIGGQFEQPRLARLARSLGLEDCVEFIPPMPPEDVRRLMQTSDIFVFPSNGTEGWGCVLNEAMAEGCAAVACCDAGAAPILIKPDVNGVLVRSNCVGAWTAALADLLSQPEKRRRFGMTAHADMHKQWSPAVAVKQFLLLIESLRGEAVDDALHYAR